VIPFPDKKYSIIYADPPWRYEHPISDSRKIENQYPTMSLEEIKNIVPPADSNCALFMWVTAPKVGEAIEIINAWGFVYRTCAVWDKLEIGMGYWFRNQHELLFVAVKGKISPPDPSERISSLLKFKIKEHSKKPKEIRSYLSKWYPERSKIELFSRDKIEGWDCWGNEIPDSEQKLLVTEEA
jgi:N6-adenosine-specific RNA methylase IME4